MSPTRPIGRRFGRPLAIPCCRQTVKRFETSGEQRFCRHSLCMDSPPSVGYLSTLGWMEPDPRAGRQPERSVKERTVKRHDFKDGEVIFLNERPERCRGPYHSRAGGDRSRAAGWGNRERRRPEARRVLWRDGGHRRKATLGFSDSEGPGRLYVRKPGRIHGYAAEPASGVHRSLESPFRAPSQGE